MNTYALNFISFKDWINYLYAKAINNDAICIYHVVRKHQEITLVVDLVNNRCGQSIRNQKDEYDEATGVAYAYARAEGLPILHEKDFLPRRKELSEIKTGDKFKLNDSVYCCKEEITIDDEDLIVCNSKRYPATYKVFNKKTLISVDMVYDGD